MDVRIGYRKIDGFLVVCLHATSTLSVFAYKSKWWQVIVRQPELDTLAGRIKSTADQYVNKLFDALANQEEEKVFSVRDETSGSIKLTWSKEAKKGMQINFGSFALDPVNTTEGKGSKELDQLLSQILGQWGAFQSRCQELELDNKRLHELGSEAVERYEKLVSEMQKREFAILNNCAQLLNEKKRKINSLMTSCEKIDMNGKRVSRETVVTNVSGESASSSHSDTEKSVALDDDDNDSGKEEAYEGNVDEDEEDDLLPKVRRTQKLFSARKSRGSSVTSR
ncbi:unnamed protein product [Echinostoma caproni]|uniref:DNA repair protein XRCC4 n=1 Tax=Echinostoma caproni TaxID=27848 RepID=A0A183AU62_9TREM|nr:unnamed protein product [Echinostoma caproni]